MNTRTLATLFVIALSVGCAHTAPTLSSDAAAVLAMRDEAHGALIYVGDVTPVGSTTAAYRYERRRVLSDGGTMTTHVTRDVATGNAVVVQQALAAADGALLRFSEVHAQTGTAASVVVDTTVATPVLRYRVTVGEVTTESTEAVTAPVVVGPTLFAAALAARPALERGEVVTVQFVVVAAATSYAFELRGRTTARGFQLEMTARDIFVRLVVAPVVVDFVDTDTGVQVAHYRGRIPPQYQGQSCDGDVAYRAVAPSFE
jgi:hypothetical protein